MSTKSRSSLSETPNKASPATQTPNKTSPATPRVSKLSKGVPKAEPESPSPLQNSRPSVERSPRSVNSKVTVERKSQKLGTAPEKPLPRVAKGSELQTQLTQAQDDLKKAKEQLIQVEKEKGKAIDGLKEAQRVAEEANEKLKEALMAQKRAEENSEIEKFRAVELEQAGIEAVNKKEEEWQKELESVRNQHALDAAALLSTTQELQRIKQELAMITDAKNQALSHADEATKIAEIQVEKAETLSAELARVKSLLNSKLETEAGENKIVLELKTEIGSLKQELEKAKDYEAILTKKEIYIEQLNVELEAAKLAESYAHSVLDEWKKRVEQLEAKLEEANKLERSASESLESVMKQLEGNNDLLHDAESEIATLKEKVGLLEMTIGRQKGDLEDSEHRLLMAKEESLEMSRKIELVEAELETVKEEKAQALNNEKLAASSVQTLLEEKNKLINELENSREEEEKSKKAMESLASALHEVSAEAREAKEKLLTSQADHENYETQIENLKLVLKATNEKYESMLHDLSQEAREAKEKLLSSQADREKDETEIEDLKAVLKATNEKYEAMLDEARHEIDALTHHIEKSKDDFEESKVEWEQREVHLVNCIKQTEGHNSSLERELGNLVQSLKESQEEASVRKEEEAQLKENLKEVEAEVIHLQEALKEAKAESMKLKESLMDKENELQSIVQENGELRTSEAASIKKVEELSKLLDEATARNKTEENGDLSDSEKDYDLLPKVVEFSEENGHAGEDISKVDVSANREGLRQNSQESSIILNDKSEKTESPKHEHANGKSKEDENKEKDDSVEDEFKMWESCKIEKKEFSPEREPEPESFEEEVDSKIEGGEGFDQINGPSSTETIDNGGSSPSKGQQLKKKKKPLLGKFGSLLKKKGASNQK
ncbi:WEB family protein At3g02930, chloroplastic-like isoform X1 [Prosopis cineraria]|uniref:WEB family protein At3g02930, chloroplastic-like isoform X1 n=2 Tax=Prosopis cineraria TaxID=364024 RepID=UPI00240F633F|nr:WEB family protein At3g02930, chloroplastic-like isoform X1 [Prosopis cineraria]